MSGLENPGVMNAAALILASSDGLVLAQSRGIADCVRVSAGQYDLTLDLGWRFGDAVPFVCVPPNTPFGPAVQVTAPGTARISMQRIDNADPGDPDVFFFTVLAVQMQEGDRPVSKAELQQAVASLQQGLGELSERVSSTLADKPPVADLEPTVVDGEAAVADGEVPAVGG